MDWRALLAKYMANIISSEGGPYIPVKPDATWSADEIAALRLVCTEVCADEETRKDLHDVPDWL